MDFLPSKIKSPQNSAAKRGSEASRQTWAAGVIERGEALVKENGEAMFAFGALEATAKSNCRILDPNHVVKTLTRSLEQTQNILKYHEIS